MTKFPSDIVTVAPLPMPHVYQITFNHLKYILVIPPFLLLMGDLMDIPHTGMSKFTHKNRVFHLNDIFLIPSTSKNLLSVYQLCCDNHVFIEFDCHKVLRRCCWKEFKRIICIHYLFLCIVWNEERF